MPLRSPPRRRLVGRLARIARRVRILGQQGASAFLVDVGDGRDDYDHPLARVYDRRARELHDPLPRDSIVARGYWDKVSLDSATRADVRGEVRELL